MRFISESIGDDRIGECAECAVIIPRFVLCSRAKPSLGQVLRLSLSCWERCSLVRGTDPEPEAGSSGNGNIMPAAFALGNEPTFTSFLARLVCTELNAASSSPSWSWASIRPSTSEAICPLSISRAMRSASSRFSFGMALGSSFVVYNSSWYVLVTPYKCAFVSNWSQARTSCVCSSRPSPSSPASCPPAQGTSSRSPVRIAFFCAISASVAKPVPALGPWSASRMDGEGTSTADTCKKSFPGIRSVLITSPLRQLSEGSSRAHLSVIEKSLSREQLWNVPS
mmetsp:Transcript_41591/g.114625  ORF Transcript_41591/g.114625 Transcript_41591/m.114625 type:complete len:282 (-) Transcript_41591:353-1198(-)